MALIISLLYSKTFKSSPLTKKQNYFAYPPKTPRTLLQCITLKLIDYGFLIWTTNPSKPDPQCLRNTAGLFQCCPLHMEFSLSLACQNSSEWSQVQPFPPLNPQCCSHPLRRLAHSASAEEWLFVSLSNPLYETKTTSYSNLYPPADKKQIFYLPHTIIGGPQ